MVLALLVLGTGGQRMPSNEEFDDPTKIDEDETDEVVDSADEEDDDLFDEDEDEEEEGEEDEQSGELRGATGEVGSEGGTPGEAVERVHRYAGRGRGSEASETWAPAERDVHNRERRAE